LDLLRAEWIIIIPRTFHAQVQLEESRALEALRRIVQRLAVEKNLNRS
jgi:hypothetical protein